MPNFYQNFNLVTPMKTFCILVVSLFLYTNMIIAQEASQWRGENRDGIYNEKGLLRSWPADGPKLLWHTETIGDGHASAAVADCRR